jgi:hypothetical protein
MSIKCPKCKQEKEIHLWVDTHYVLGQSGKIELACEPDWKHRDDAWCEQCHHQGTVSDFIVEG